MLIETLKTETLAARRAKIATPTVETDTKAALLTTLLADVQKIAKDKGRIPTDDDATSVIKRYLSTAADNLRDIQDAAARQVVELEKAVLEALLPAQASAEEVSAEIARLIAESNLRGLAEQGTVMKALKTKFGANFDAGAANKLVRQALT